MDSSSPPPGSPLAQRDALRALLQATAHQRPQAAIARQRARGKGLVRERLAALLDSKAPFLEIGALAAHDCYPEAVPGAGVVAGIGLISGQLCMVIANDVTVKGGCYFPLTVKKHLRALEIARDNRLPCVYLVDSGGIFLPRQAECFADADHFGRIFYLQSQLSALGIPQWAAVLGMCTAGGAYVPAMADETIMVAKQASMHLAGPPLVEAATGEVSSAEHLGGGAMHAQLSGAIDYLVDSEAQALALLRRRIALHEDTSPVPPPLRAPRPPQCDPQTIYSLLPGGGAGSSAAAKGPIPPIPMDKVLSTLLDGGDFLPFKPAYGPSLLCGFGFLQGYQVGIVANQGVLFGPCVQKGAQFINLCDARGIPLIFLQDITGFMVGKDVEQRGIIKDGAKMVHAVSCASVPKLTLICGASHGAGNYAMCGRAYGARFVFSWPGSRIGVMGAQQAAFVLDKVGKQTPAEAGDFVAQSSALYATARLWDDGIIPPCESRAVLGLALAAALRNGAAPRPAGPLLRH